MAEKCDPISTPIFQQDGSPWVYWMWTSRTLPRQCGNVLTPNSEATLMTRDLYTFHLTGLWYFFNFCKVIDELNWYLKITGKLHFQQIVAMISHSDLLKISMDFSLIENWSANFSTNARLKVSMEREREKHPVRASGFQEFFGPFFWYSVVATQRFFIFIPTLGKISNLTNILKPPTSVPRGLWIWIFLGGPLVIGKTFGPTLSTHNFSH